MPKLYSPSSGQGPSSQLSLQSDDGGSFAGSDRELSVHRAASIWELPTGVVPPEDSPPRDSSSSLWASSMSCRGWGGLLSGAAPARGGLPGTHVAHTPRPHLESVQLEGELLNGVEDDTHIPEGQAGG